MNIGAAWAVGLLGCLATAPLAAAGALDEDTSLARTMLAELVAIDTSEPNGSTKAAEALARRFLDAGFAGPDVQLLAPAEHPEKANLVVRIRGRGGARAVLWTSHLDVVGATPKDWSTPPFTLTERDGWYYGRGVSDMKGEAVAVASALIRLKRERFVPVADVVAIFTADEEAAGKVNGVRWLLQAHPKLIQAAVALNPDAGGAATRNGRPLYFGLQTAEKTYATFILEMKGKGGHSSRPGPENVIYDLASALLRVKAYRFPVSLTSTTRAFLRGSAELEQREVAADMKSLASDPNNSSAADRLSARTDLNAVIRTTCVATMLSAGEAENALAQQARATIQCRLIPGDKPEDIRRTLVGIIADPRVTVRLDRPVNPAPETTPDPITVKAVEEVVGSVWPNVPVVLRMDSGGSDAIFTRAAGLPTYGVSTIPTEIGDDRHHGVDERISKQGFREGLDFAYRLTKRLASATASHNSSKSIGSLGAPAAPADTGRSK